MPGSGVMMTFAEMPDDGCRFEVGGADAVANYLFCGQPAIAGKPYCRAHYEIAYQTIETDQFRRGPAILRAA
jgi:GcrA cell cycle regulator